MLPGMGIDREIKEFFLACLQDSDIKAELSRQIETEVRTSRNKYSQYSMADFEALTTPNVNMQYRMAQSGYDVYGNTIISSNKPFTNSNTAKKMKNRIRYGKRPERGMENRGGYNII